MLAGDVQLHEASDSDKLRFALTGEGGLNDRSAFPFVMMGQIALSYGCALLLNAYGFLS